MLMFLQLFMLTLDLLKFGLVNFNRSFKVVSGDLFASMFASVLNLVKFFSRECEDLDLGVLLNYLIVSCFF